MKYAAEDSSDDTRFEPERSARERGHRVTSGPLFPSPVSPMVEPDEEADGDAERHERHEAPDETARQPISRPPHLSAQPGGDHFSDEEMRAYLSRLDTSRLSPSVRNVVDEYRRAALSELETRRLPATSARKRSDGPQPVSEQETDRLSLAEYQAEAAFQDTDTLRAALAEEQARHMGAPDLSPHTRRAIRDYARRQSGAPAPDPEAAMALSRQLQEAGIPEDIRDAIIEFAAGPRGVTGAPYFSPESEKLDTDGRAVVMALRSEFESGHAWWRRWLSALIEPATLIMFLFAAVQVWLVLGQRTGPFLDEAIYIDAGIRALQGYGFADNYLTWFAGSLLWPVIAALGYQAGGLVGVRLIAVACTTIAGLATASASRNLFGRTAGVFAALAFAFSGPVIHLAHLAVYDQIALAGVALSFWAITCASVTRQRVWLVVAAVALGVGAISKYPMIVCLIPLIGVTIALRAKRVFADIFILVFLIAAILLSYVLPVRDQLVALVYWRTQNNPSFGVTTDMVRYGLLFYGFTVWALALVGWFVVRGKRRLAIALIGGMLLWPAYHVVIDNSVSAEKHLVFGFLFGFPLVGAVFAALWRRSGWQLWPGRAFALLTILALAVIGVSQAQTLDAGWADTRPATAYLLAHVKPNERLLISNAAPYQLALYTHGKITSPWDVYDTYRVQHNQFETSVCEADWFVDEEGGNGWPRAIREKVMACGTFKEVFSSVSDVTQLGSDLRLVTYPVRTTVWVNIAKH